MSLINDLRSNYRLRIGLSLIVGIVWLSWLLDLRDTNVALVEQYKQIASQVARFSTQQKQGQWLARAEQAKAALAAAQARVWQNPSLGLTQAEMQDWLLQQLSQAKAVRYTVKVSEGENNLGGDPKNDQSDNASSDLKKVRAKLEFNADPQVLSSVLAAIATADHQIVVESMIVKPPRTEITVSAWYKLQPAAAVSVSLPPAAR